ncbi:MAG: hypothetical protein LBG72_00925 [Spirochaetaceae bacterium]|jgi:hypothetical protein|nr:hypothetical protein [Spirochaetaceae bacterium]
MTKRLFWRLAPLAFLWALNAAPCFSQSKDIITAVKITGLKRTKPRTAEEPLRRFIGEDASSLDTDKVKAAVIDQGILEPLSVSLDEAPGEQGKILAVDVKEKWSLFVGPFFFAGTGSISAGLFFFDANAFGLSHRMIAGGMYQNGGWLALLIYIAPPGGAGRLGWFAAASFSDWEQRNAGADNNTLRLYNARTANAEFSPQYQITNALNAAFNLAYKNIMILDTGDTVLKPDTGTQFIQLGPEITLRKTGWDGYLLSEESVSVKYNLIQDIASPSWHSLSFKGIYEKPLLPGFRLNVHGGGIFRPDVPALLEEGPGGTGTSILPVSFSARHYAGISLGLEKYLYRFSFGTASLFGAWQMAYSNGPILGSRFDYGAALSLRFYLSRLAIPAFGAGVTYNIPARYFQFAFSIGMTI